MDNFSFFCYKPAVLVAWGAFQPPFLLHGHFEELRECYEAGPCQRGGEGGGNVGKKLLTLAGRLNSPFVSTRLLTLAGEWSKMSLTFFPKVFGQFF